MIVRNEKENANDGVKEIIFKWYRLYNAMIITVFRFIWGMRRKADNIFSLFAEISDQVLFSNNIIQIVCFNTNIQNLSVHKSI